MNDKVKNEELEAMVKQHLEREFNKGMLIGAQAACTVILNKITQLYKKEKPTANDMKRLIKDIRGFCVTGVSRKVNPDGTTTPVDETAQN
jgi:hypothetical protein